jgi:penicillin-binding protein 2
MIGPMDERTPPMTPQLALRVAIIGGLALAMFAVIFFRLWFLQVLSGSHYVQAAQVNIVRDIPVAAPRGEILDRSGTPLVESVRVPSILISPETLPTPVSLSYGKNGKPYITQAAKDYALYGRLARLLQMSTKPRTCSYQIYGNNGPINYSPKLAPIPCRVAQGVAASQYANVTIKSKVTPDIQDYILERQTQFPGVVPQEVYQRKYPLGDAGAQIFGMLSPISALEVAGEKHTKAYKGIEQGNIVGQTGLEANYNDALQGINGEERVKVNSANEFQGYAKGKASVPGENLKLSISAKLEQVGQRSLAHSITVNAGAGADAGAFIAMNPDTGAIYAMGSAPTYNPAHVSPSISTKEWHYLQNPANNEPLENRAIQGEGPDGSTFKVITATAALESGVMGLDDSTYDDTGQFCYPGEDPTLPGACLHNSGGVGNGYGSVDLQRALQVSDDDYFYHLGWELNTKPIETAAHADGGALQQWARNFGIGQATGVDLPGEASGTLPSPGLLLAKYKLEHECETATGIYSYINKQLQISATPKPGYHRSPKQPASKGGCGIANPVKADNSWTEGDNVNTAVGQGDDQLTPMQLAVVYSALANGGKIVTPHVALGIQSQTGTVSTSIDPAPKRRIDIQPAYRQAILEGLNEAAQSPGGTSDDVMGDFGQTVYGKTGTAQYGTAAEIQSRTEHDSAWYACFVQGTATRPPITVIVWVEKGGFGDVAAAPVARQILSQWFYGKTGPYKAGTSTDQ